VYGTTINVSNQILSNVGSIIASNVSCCNLSNIYRSTINVSGQTLSNVAVYATTIGINTAAGTTVTGSSPAATTLLNLATTAGTQVCYIDTNGGIMTNGDITAYANLSDRRLKEHIVLLSNVTCLEKINAIQPVEFTWRSNEQLTAGYAGKTDIGMIAQDLEVVIPQAVCDKNILEYGNYKTVKYEKLIPILIGAVQSLTLRVEQLEADAHRSVTMLDS